VRLRGEGRPQVLSQHPPLRGRHAVFGFAEWNGRSLTDNAPNVMFSVAANAPVSLGLAGDVEHDGALPSPGPIFLSVHC
jgi:hypothetical protein